MRIFKNPSNGYHERVGGFSILLALLFGVFYFMAKGVWMHVAIQLVISALLLVSLGPPGIMLVLIMWVVYALVLPGVLAKKYLRDGWIEVTSGEPAAGVVAPAATAAAPTTTGVQASDVRPCPFCAEPIKRAAIKCKHCGSTVEADRSVEVARAAELAERTARAEAEARRPKGTCPNCLRVIPLDSKTCSHCNADFGPGSAFLIKPI